MNSAKASNLVSPLLLLGLLLHGVWDGDVQRGPQRRRVAAAEGRLAGIMGSFYSSTSQHEGIKKLEYLQQQLQLLDLLREEFRDQLLRLFGDNDRKQSENDTTASM